jgi:hypothetical protein
MLKEGHVHSIQQGHVSMRVCCQATEVQDVSVESVMKHVTTMVSAGEVESSVVEKEGLARWLQHTTGVRFTALGC